MISARRFIYAALLALTALSIAPARALGQASRGHFKLTHSVLWEKAVVPAGEYDFTFKGEGATGVLTLTKIDSPHAGFLFMVTDSEESRIEEGSKLTLRRISAGTYASAMTLADQGIVLYFTPPRSAEKVIARAENQTQAAAR